MQLTPETIAQLVTQVLRQHGPLPVGEVGKQLQVLSGDSGESVLVT